MTMNSYITPNPRVIVALDYAELQQAERLIDELQGLVLYYKIGFELFSAYGWQAMNLVKKYGARIFLDLKIHDIPNTAARTAAVLCEHRVDMFNVHALGGIKMMAAVRESVNKTCGSDGKPAVVAVTVLTSHEEAELSTQMGIQKSLNEEVLLLADAARKAGLDGVVSSPQELSLLRCRFSHDFLIVTPGIRAAGAASHDQKRIYAAKEALDLGASYIVIGRPITADPHPRQAAENIIRSVQ